MNNVKIVVYVPTTHSDKLREAIGKAGAGTIGNYSYCSFSIRGLGRFKPNDKAKPHIGKANILEQVEEERIEFNCPKEDVKKVIKAMRKVHPYEEMTYDIYQLSNEL